MILRPDLVSVVFQVEEAPRNNPNSMRAVVRGVVDGFVLATIAARLFSAFRKRRSRRAGMSLPLPLTLTPPHDDDDPVAHAAETSRVAALIQGFQTFPAYNQKEIVPAN
jgi:hypothetical protein